MRPQHFIWLGATALVLAGCGTTSANSPAATGTAAASTPPASTSTPSASSATVEGGTASVNGSSEQVLTNASGMTLYYFTPDSATSVSCTGGCASTWPPLLLSSGQPNAAMTLSQPLTVLSGTNGRQVEYAGHPLYTYSGDSAPGDAHGEGIGGKWFVATPSLTAAAGAASSTNPYGY